MNNITASEWRKKFQELIPWSEEQLNVFKAVRETKDNILIEAVPGSGKSTTLIGITGVLPATSKVQLLAFNKGIVQELKDDNRLKRQGITVSTAHSIALYNLKRVGILPNDDWSTPDPGKYSKKLGTYLKRIKNELLDSIKISLKLDNTEEDLEIAKEVYRNLPDRLANIISLAQLNVEREVSKYFYDYTCYNHSIRIPVEDTFKPTFISFINQALEWGLEEAKENNYISYDDILWLFNLENKRIRVPIKDVVLVDECQDLNKAMIGIIKTYVKKGARVIFVGDPNQAIQGFAGSDAYSWQSIINLFDPLRLPLHKSFRCPLNHINLAKQIVPYLEGAKNEEGCIVEEDYDYLVEEVQLGHVVLARTKAQLVKLYLSLLYKNKPAKIKDIDSVIKSLKIFLGQVFPFEGKLNLQEINNRLDNLYNIAKSKFREDLERLSFYEETYKSLVYLNNYIKENREVTVYDYKEYLDLVSTLLIVDSPEYINLSTIHSYKGCENNNVWIMNYSELPKTVFTGIEWQIEQEKNLLFVALTRSKQTMYLID